MESQQQVNQGVGQIVSTEPHALPPAGIPSVTGGLVVGLENEMTIQFELQHVYDKMKAVRAFVFDVDGVFTNNDLLVTEAGEFLRTMNVRDGQAIKWAVAAGYSIGIITGGASEGVKKRFTHQLGISEYYSGIQDKLVAFQSFMQRSGIQSTEICYMGDDLPDIPPMRKSALACCPADAVPEVMATCDYISTQRGGEGCVRDVIEKVLKLQGKWPTY
ncbi:MAG: HAD-IIIA family hydrolase [Saprospiraceae bacterium]|nr:HAD-IIIA family hydrolase [Saprospiraceae bacterium]